MEPKHSGPGIASFIMSIGAAILTFLTIVAAGAIEVSTPGGMDEKSLTAFVVGVFVIAFMFVSVLALGLGVAGLVQSDRKKLFAIIGIVISSMTLLGTVALIFIGLSMD